EVTVDLPGQTLTLLDGEQFEFAIDANRKRALVEGLDDIGMTLAHAHAIREFER
ncbi:MAG: 3-isopropylmalate dehydratase small subunit, partial [Gammaproteobacteria bacterium]|nr:3-isopropylmalate dehydratase small subunit [Gammaproteobacteria bacterium]